MPSVIGYHHVTDHDHWLNSDLREKKFGELGVTNIRTFTTRPTRHGWPSAAMCPTSPHSWPGCSPKTELPPRQATGYSSTPWSSSSSRRPSQDIARASRAQVPGHRDLHV